MHAHVVVLGAGYAGLPAARLIAERCGAATTLVNASALFVERVRLHQVAAGQRVRQRSMAELLDGSGVELVVDRATAIDTGRREVVLSDGGRLGYDVLVCALGSVSDVDTVPGAAEHARPLATAEDSALLREELVDARGVAVVGGGLTGIEAAAELAESRPELDVRLLTAGRLGAALSGRGREHLRRVFDRLGVDVREHAPVAEVRADGAVLRGGEHVPADVVVWAAGFRAPDLPGEAGIAVDRRGRILVDGALRSVSHPDVYAVGDVAAARCRDGRELRMACATGLPSARQVARAVGDRLAGRQPGALRFRYLNQCISLGRHDALVQYVRRDDTPVELVLTGRIAALYKEVIVRGALAAQRRPVLLRLAPGGPARRRAD